MIAWMLALSAAAAGDGYFVNREHGMVQLWWVRTGQEMALGRGDLRSMELVSDGAGMAAMVWHLSSGDTVVSHELACAKVASSIQDAWLMLHGADTPVEVVVGSGACSLTSDRITSDPLPPADAWLPERGEVSLAWADPSRLRVMRRGEVTSIGLAPLPQDAAALTFTLWDGRTYQVVDANCEGRKERMDAVRTAVQTEVIAELGVCGFEPPWTLAVQGIKNIEASDAEALQALLMGAMEVCGVDGSGATTLKGKRKKSGAVDVSFKDSSGSVPEACLSTQLASAIRGKQMARLAWRKN